MNVPVIICILLIYSLMVNSSQTDSLKQSVSLGIVMPHTSYLHSPWQEFLSALESDFIIEPIFCIKRMDGSIFHNPSLLHAIKSKHGKISFVWREDEICGLEEFIKNNSSMFIYFNAASSDLSDILETILLVQQSRIHRIEQNFGVILKQGPLWLGTTDHCGLHANKTYSKLMECLFDEQITTTFHNTSMNHCDSQSPKSDTLDLRNSFHESGPCQLWWPFNQSDLFLHSHIPADLSPLRMKQKFIIACFNHDESHFQEYTVVLQDFWSSPQCLNCYSFRTINLPAYDVPQIFESVLELHRDDTYEGIGSKKHLAIKIARSDTGTQLSEFHLVLNINYGSQYWIDYSNAAPNKCPVHPMASQLETRDDLGFALNALLPNASSFLEVGVQHGNFAQIMLNTWKSLQTYIAVDPWKSWPSNVYYDIANNVQAVQDQIHLRFLLDIQKYGSKIFVLRMESLYAADLIVDESIDVVYLDAMHHYFAVKSDIEAWWPKVKPGGLLSGHDYVLDVMHSTIFTAKPAVDEFARKHGLMVLYTNDDVRPAYPSWFIFKPCH